jgi:hypothetical protein
MAFGCRWFPAVQNHECGRVAARTEQPLDIVIYGATGKVGSHVVHEALDRGDIFAEMQYLFDNLIRRLIRMRFGNIAALNCVF